MLDLNLTDVERLILANQYEILGALKKDTHYTKLAEALRDGHKWLYEQSLEGVSEVMSDNVAEDVLRIIEIYSAMKDSYRDLADKSGIDEHLLEFRGFDGNNEGELLHFARALRENGRYEDTLKHGDINSHMPMCGIYDRMVGAWVKLGRPEFPYSREAILAILEARKGH